jgi:hypothetical protein
LQVKSSCEIGTWETTQSLLLQFHFASSQTYVKPTW